MELKEFHYDLPDELIAQYPMERGTERLMVVECGRGCFQHKIFSDLTDYLRAGDCLVLNDTRVIPARFIGEKATGGKVELLLLKMHAPARWDCLIKAAKPPRVGAAYHLGEGLIATVEAKKDEGYQVAFNRPDLLSVLGETPLPPYIHRTPDTKDRETYQTVYARHDGSIAAPTAGLHFTSDHLERLKAKGVVLAFITLHVGPGTFIPVRTERIEDHRMLAEEFNIPDEAAVTINHALDEGRRIVAIGTTTTRVLEHIIVQKGRMIPGWGSSDLFIIPGFTFRCVSALLTNFHLPCSTLFMLATAFGGYDLIRAAYREAIKKKYRFFSYGDAMLIL